MSELNGDQNTPQKQTSERQGRTRRRTTKAVDYSKEQEFSDDDIFEDGLKDDNEKNRRTIQSLPPVIRKGRGRPRKSNTDPEAVVSFQDLDTAAVGGVAIPTASKSKYVERGYDPSELPIRERYLFEPEFEPDGSAKIELIVGRRPIEKNRKGDDVDNDDYDEPNNMDEEQGKNPKKKSGRKKNSSFSDDEMENSSPTKEKQHFDYEYLIKYKGKSYLHLEWKSGADLESMNKSAKTLYRRFLKKLQAGGDDNLEDPTFDPAYAEPQKIVDEKDQTVQVELSDKEFAIWKKKREKEMNEEKEVDNHVVSANGNTEEIVSTPRGDRAESKVDNMEVVAEDNVGELSDLNDEDTDETKLKKIRKILKKDAPYYPTFPGSDNPYRDGYLTSPPKKPRASYLFYQCAYRSFYQKKYKGASQGDIMTILGDTWRSMSDQEMQPFVDLAKEEAEQYEKERIMMEKAQRPNELWQPSRRCQMVLDRISSDPFASIFLEPVNVSDFPDYLDIIDQPMDLGTVRKKLKNKKYQAPEIFARDMRKIWNNCKIFNLHGSAIWYIADYMSKQFERLYNAWVLEFRERYLRWINPKARPWEQSCRQCDGMCVTSDEKMVLCDHCDAMYGLNCLQPPLQKPPRGIWLCPECTGLKKKSMDRLLSAVQDQAARRRAELGDVPKKKVTRKMFLVKWEGLGYENCTWETQADINDEELIDKYRRLNNMIPDEPKITKKQLQDIINNSKHVYIDNAKGSSYISDFRSNIYAQTRALHFSRFGKGIPKLLAKQCGPKTYGSTIHYIVPDKSSSASWYHKDVTTCVFDLVSSVVYGTSRHELKISETMPECLIGEYNAVIPITEKGLMMNVGEVNGSVSFLGYREFPDGRKGPAEEGRLIRNIGDKIIAVDGTTTVRKTFSEVIQLLLESGKNKYAFMRFLESKYSVNSCDLTSMGRSGKLITNNVKRQFRSERREVIGKRRQKVNDNPNDRNKDDEDSDESVSNEVLDDDDSDGEGSEDEFVTDGDDYEIVLKERQRQNDTTSETALPGNKIVQSNEKVPSIQSSVEEVKSSAVFAKIKNTQNETQRYSEAVEEDANEHFVQKNDVKNAEKYLNQNLKKESIRNKNVSAFTEKSTTETEGNKKLLQKPIRRFENTRSLALRLLDVDLGYSSDEGGCYDSAYFCDCMDLTFSTEREARNAVEVSDCEEKEDKREKGEASKKEIIPVKSNEFSVLGEQSKILVATTLSTNEPNTKDFDAFFNDVTKIESESKHANDEKMSCGQKRKCLVVETSGKKSLCKIEQLSTTSNEVVHVWASVEEAASTLQIPMKDIKQVLNGDYNEDLGDEAGGFRWRYADEDAKVTNMASKGRDAKKGKLAYLEFRDKLYDQKTPYIYKGGHKLRDYQVDGVNWLASCWYKRHGCILADEMGLGKTVQIVTYIEHIFRVEKIARPYLVVVPLSTVEHWRREFQGWTDMQCCVYHDRQREWRDVMREYEWYYADRPHNHEFLKFDVLVTTYDTLISDFDVLGQIPWRVTVVDEAHRLRNVKGKLLECMKQISARGTLQYGFQSRVLMTGTPLQNNTQELWTLLNFIEPFKFPSLEDFQANYGNMANREQVESLQRKISPFMLRRVKEDVAKDIPAKEETVIDVELTSIQKQYYRAIFEHNHSFLSMGTNRATAPKLMNIQMELRKCCNHPFLLDGVESRELDKYHKELTEEGKMDNVSAEEQQNILNEHGYVNTSGKMVLLNKLLPKLKQEGHKILIFSQMVKMLDLISEFCDFKGFKHERLDGRVRGSERQKAIDRFENEDDSFVFLLSTRAGGVGINLTAADICIIFDSDWNPQNDVQAQARCHRIGQTKDVMIYRLITSRTFEQEMFDRASKKLGLEQAVLGTFGQDNDDDKPTSKEMEQLLKKGAYALLEDDDEKGKEFCEDDIDSILAKRTRTRVVEGAKTSAWLNKSGMNVSKSKFTGDSAAATANVDVDDPLFWQKVMPDFVTPTIMMTKLKDMIKAFEKPKSLEGPGRGRKKKENLAGAEHNLNQEIENIVKETTEKKSGTQTTRTQQKKSNQFMADLSSMMENIFEDDEDDNLPTSEKTICQNLLLTITVKEKMFTDEHRNTARRMLKRLEGDRRRRCRTTGDENNRYAKVRRPVPDVNLTQTGGSSIPEELLILSKHKRRKRRLKEKEKDLDVEKADRNTQTSSPQREGGFVGEDGFLHHSDSEIDWSDVGEDIYKSKKKRGISRKEARRRRAWASDKDPAAAAGRLWPVFPRNEVSKILKTMLDEVIKNDKKKKGLFSIPVPRDVFPEYYDVVKRPMDYGTMQKKLSNGEYRSAQAMQKDFLLVMQNCLLFNAADSDIVREARRQALGFPNMLKNAALKHNLFICEDGTILEVYSDDENEEAQTNNLGNFNSKDKKLSKRGRDRRSKRKHHVEKSNEKMSSSSKVSKHKQFTIPKKRESHKKIEIVDDSDATHTTESDIESSDSSKEKHQPPKKPRIRISLGQNGTKIPKKRSRSAIPSEEKPSRNEEHAIDSSPKIIRKRIKVKHMVSNEGDNAFKIQKKIKSQIHTAENEEDKSDTEEGEIVEDDENEETHVKDDNIVTNNIKDEKKCSDRKVDAKKIPKNTGKSTISDKMAKFCDNNDPAFDHMDVDTIQREFDNLNVGISAVRKFVTKRGQWVVPQFISEDKCLMLAKIVLNKVSRYDTYRLFAEKVTESEAPGYSEAIANPMDFGTMRKKIEDGSYGEGSKILGRLYNDFLLVFDNCAQYNDLDSDVVTEAANVMSQLPGAYAYACSAVMEKSKRSSKRIKKKKE